MAAESRDEGERGEGEEEGGVLVSLHPLEPQLLPLVLWDTDGGGLSCIEDLGHSSHQVLGIVCQHLTRLPISLLIWQGQEGEEREGSNLEGKINNSDT